MTLAPPVLDVWTSEKVWLVCSCLPALRITNSRRRNTPATMADLNCNRDVDNAAARAEATSACVSTPCICAVVHTRASANTAVAMATAVAPTQLGGTCMSWSEFA